MAARKNKKQKKLSRPATSRVSLHIQIEERYDRGAAWAGYLSTMSFLRHEEGNQQVAQSLKKAGKSDAEVRRAIAERDRRRTFRGYYVSWF